MRDQINDASRQAAEMCRLAANSVRTVRGCDEEEGLLAAGGGMLRSGLLSHKGTLRRGLLREQKSRSFVSGTKQSLRKKKDGIEFFQRFKLG